MVAHADSINLDCITLYICINLILAMSSFFHD